MAVLVVLAQGNKGQAQLVSIDTVLVGDAGNPADSTGFGEVAYDFLIGKTEVTISQYTAFLNAVAATDTFGLYNAGMATDLNVAEIAQSGSSGSFTYSVIGSGNRPVTYVGWFEAARFTNWLQNGATAGADTENGAYTLGGATTGTFDRNPDATWWLPSENEWYKAAYYQAAANGGDADGYWLYPTRSNDLPGNAVGELPNQANYVTGGVYSVTQNGTLDPSLNYLTDGGSFTGSASYYGTFDQGGNVWELMDTILTPGIVVDRGGSWVFNGAPPSNFLDATAPDSTATTYDGNFYLGFRVASVPEPSALALMLVGLIGGALWWAKRRKVTA